MDLVGLKKVFFLEEGPKLMNQKNKKFQNSKLQTKIRLKSKKFNKQ